MKTYHVLFLCNHSDTFSMGKNYQAKDEVDAIQKFRDQFPNAVFLGLYLNNIKELVAVVPQPC